jgi:hypothetical protein
MSRISVCFFQALLVTAGLAAFGGAAVGAESSDQEAAYTRAITKRADKIVAALGLADEAQRERVRDLVVQQYRNLREIHAARDAKLSEAKHSPGDAAVAEAFVKVARDAAGLKLVEAHRKFVARLAVELPPEQVEKVKDGMTYGVVDITYKRYLELFPQLKDGEKREILADLVEAREYAMDGGTSEE